MLRGGECVFTWLEPASHIPGDPRWVLLAQWVLLCLRGYYPVGNTWWVLPTDHPVPDHSFNLHTILYCSISFYPIQDIKTRNFCEWVTRSESDKIFCQSIEACINRRLNAPRSITAFIHPLRPYSGPTCTRPHRPWFIQKVKSLAFGHKFVSGNLVRVIFWVWGMGTHLALCQLQLSTIEKLGH